MAIAKRIFFFALVNILIITTITVSLTLLNVFFGIDLTSFTGLEGLLIFCLIFGMGGAFVSLWISKFMAKRMMGVKIIDPNTTDPGLRDMIQTVYRLATRAGLKKMPEVGIYQGQEVNAFATGPSRNNSLVAVSSGLLQKMDKDQVEGVLGHEVAHIANGDMVTMALIQGVINALVMFAARIIANIISSQMDNKAGPFLNFGIIIGLQILLSFLSMPIVAFFSRWREYRADLGSAKIAGKEKMIGALQALQGTTELIDNQHKAMNTMKISTGRSAGLMKYFSTHPPLEDRIRRLQKRTNF